MLHRHHQARGLQQQQQPPPTRAPSRAPTTSPNDETAGGGAVSPTPAGTDDTITTDTTATLAPPPVTPVPTPIPQPTMAPTMPVTESPTPLPTPPPPTYVTMTVALTLVFPAGPGNVTWRNFGQSVPAQNTIKVRARVWWSLVLTGDGVTHIHIWSPHHTKTTLPSQDGLTRAIIAIKRPDIENVTSVRGTGRLTELRLRVKLNTLLPTTGPYSAPTKYYEALRVQFRNAHNDGSLNRDIQYSAVANGVDVSLNRVWGKVKPTRPVVSPKPHAIQPHTPP